MRQIQGWAIALLAFVLGIAVAYVLAGNGVVFSSKTVEPPTPTSDVVASDSDRSTDLSYEFRSLDTSDVHILIVPHHASWSVRPLVAPDLQSLETFAAESGAIAVINGGYFDPVNGLSTSFVMQREVMVADPQDNPRLMENPDLTSYLPQILNRSEFRRYQCGTTWQYAIAFHTDPVPASCLLVDALAAGPRLLPQDTSLEEGFMDEADGVVIRDAIGASTPNARSAVGITADGDVILLMVSQPLETHESAGMSLAEVADLLRSLGAVEAMNLDGGSSSGLVYEGNRFYGKVDASGGWIDRPVKSALAVQFSVS